MIMHSTAAQPDNTHAPPTTSHNHPAVPFTGGATLDGHRVRRGTGACARLEQAHPRLAIARLILYPSSQADIPYTSYPFTSKSQQTRGLHETHSSFLACLQGELWRSRPGPMSLIGGASFYFLQCGGLERRAAKPDPATSTTSSCGFRAALQRRT